MSPKKQQPKPRPKIIRSQSSLSSIRSQSKHELSRMSESMRDRIGYISSLYSASIPGMKTLRKLQSKRSKSTVKQNRQTTSDQIWRTNRLVDAAVDGQSDNVKWFLSPEEKLENVNGFHQVLNISALHGAARAGFVDIVEVLIEHGAKVDLRRRIKGETPMHLACSTGKTDVVEILLKHGADKTIKNALGQTALDIAFLHGHDHMKGILFGKPYIPIDINCNQCTSSTADICWQSPKDNGSPIIEFIVLWKEPEGKWSVMSGLTSCECHLQNLRPAMMYSVSIRARNAAGTSEKSAPIKFVTSPSKPDKLGSPFPFRQTANTLVMAWDAPRDNGYKIERYELQFRYKKLAESTKKKDINSSQGLSRTRSRRRRQTGMHHDSLKDFVSARNQSKSSNVSKTQWKVENVIVPFEKYEFNDLQRRTWYMFRVRAKNYLGWSEWSDFSNAVETLDCPTVHSVAARHLNILWRAVPNAVAYRVQFQAVSEDSLNLVGEVWTTLQSNFTSAGDIIQIPNLLPATYYRVRVQDYNELFGWSPSANCSPVLTSNDVPDMPKAPRVVHTSTTTLRLQVPPPICNGSDITKLQYRCVAKDENGNEIDEGKSNIEGDSDCEVVWKGRYMENKMQRNDIIFTIVGLRISVHYEVQIRFKNDCGFSKWGAFSEAVKTQASAPEPPGNLRGGEILAKSVKINWDAPITDNGSSITMYKLQMKYVGPAVRPNESEDREKIYLHGPINEWIVVSSSIKCTDFKVENLRPGSKYQFRAFAANRIGWSTSSVPTQIIETACLPPGVTEPPFLVHTNMKYIIIGWHQPTETGGAEVESFEIQQRNSRQFDTLGKHSEYDDQSETSTADTRHMLYNWKTIGHVVNKRNVESLRFTADSLGCGVYYEFRIRTKNKKGWGDFGESSRPFLTKANVPSQPSRAVCISKGSTCLCIKWLPPVLDNGDEVFHYEIGIERLAAVPEGPKEFETCSEQSVEPYDGTLCERKLLGLLPNSIYAVYVRAKNKIGWSEWGEKSFDMTTTTSAPGAPAAPIVSTFKERSAKIEWSSVRDNGLEIDMFELQRLTIGNSWETLGEWTVLMRDMSYEFNANDLLPSTNYSFRIRAHNVAGWGPPSEGSAWFQTHSSVPSKPGKPRQVLWDGQTLTLGWKHSAGTRDSSHDNGSNILFYEVQRREMYIDETLTQWETVIKSKDKFCEYKEAEPLALERWFRLRAKNAKGYSKWSDKSNFVLRRLTVAERQETKKRRRPKRLTKRITVVKTKIKAIGKFAAMSASKKEREEGGRN